MYRDELLKLGYTEDDLFRIRNSLSINTYREDTIYSRAIDNFRFFFYNMHLNFFWNAAIL